MQIRNKQITEWQQTLIDVAQCIQDKASINNGVYTEWDRQSYDKLIKMQKEIVCLYQTGHEDGVAFFSVDEIINTIKDYSSNPHPPLIYGPNNDDYGRNKLIVAIKEQTSADIKYLNSITQPLIGTKE